MKKFLFLFILSTLFITNVFCFEKFEYSKVYSPSVFGGGKEKITVDDVALIRDLYLNDVVTKVDLYRSKARVKSYFYLQNKNKSQIVDFTFSYPKIDITLSKETLDLDEGFDVKSVSNEDKIIDGSYENFKISIDGVDEPYVHERGVVVESNIPFKFGNESLLRTNGDIASEEVDSYTYLYGWYHSSVSLEPNSKCVICVSYTVPLYQNIVKIFGRVSFNYEDPALQYDYCDKQFVHNDFEECRVLYSEKIFSYYQYVPYKSDVIAKKRNIQFVSHIIDDDFIQISSLKVRKSQKSYSFSYRWDNFNERDNIYVKMLPYNNPNTVPTYYFDFTPSKKHDNGATMFTLDKNNQEIILKYNQNNKRVNSSLLPKKDTIDVREIRILANGLVKSRNTTFTISLSDNESFENCITKAVQLSLPQYNEDIAKNGYFVLFNDEVLNVKYIKIKVHFNNLADDGNRPIFINDIEILQ